MEEKETVFGDQRPRTPTGNKRVSREKPMTAFSEKNHQRAHSSTSNIKNDHSSDERRCPNLSSDSDEENDDQSEGTSCQSENAKLKRKLSSESNRSKSDSNEGGGGGSDNDNDNCDDEKASDQYTHKRRKLSQDIKENVTSAASENEATQNNSEPPAKFASFVAAFYNSVEQKFNERESSPIFYLRNFNNWIKTNLIDDCINRLHDNSYIRNLRVLDMCCGKGGDIIKWLKVNARYLVMTDIADVSLENCKERFVDLCNKFRRNGEVQQEVILADCTRDQLMSKYKDPSIKFNIVSCQFSFHYCFESLPQAECMLKNATESLKPGGFFIGTLPNANEIVKRLTLAGSNQFGNSIFSLKMITEKPYPLFGAKYEFKLEGVVDCPEFLVHFPTFERLAHKFGLKLVAKHPFYEVYERKKNTGRGFGLLKKMRALETYPLLEKGPSKRGPEEYVHAEVAWEKKGSEGSKLGTLSKSEWEVITLYDTFIFQKQKS